MPNDTDGLKDTLRRWTLVLGVLQVTVGCLVGLIPPSAVEWFRGVLMAHIEFTANGVLVVVLGLLLRDMQLARPLLLTWFATLQVGTWTNGAAGLAGAFSGASAKVMPTINAQFPPPHGTDNPVVSGLLLACAVAIIAALLLTLYGLLAARGTATGAKR